VSFFNAPVCDVVLGKAILTAIGVFDLMQNTYCDGDLQARHCSFKKVSLHTKPRVALALKEERDANLPVAIGSKEECVLARLKFVSALRMLDATIELGFPVEQCGYSNP
jgi:hypothetical protein